MHIGMVTPYFPVPLITGANVAIFHMVRSLQERHQVTVVVGVWDDGEAARLSALRAAWPGVEVIPARITGIAPSRGRHPFMYSPAADVVSLEMQAAVDRLVHGGALDVLVFEFIRSASFASEQSPIPLVLVDHELQHIRLQRAVRSEANWLRKWQLLKSWFFVRGEQRELYRRFAKIVVFSDIDRQHVLRLSPESDVAVSPFGVDTDVFVPPPSDGFERRLVFVGGDIHGPNVDAVRYSCERILPLLRREAPDLALDVVGAWTAANRQAVDRVAGGAVRWRGFVPDLRDAVAGGIVAAPIRYGSGIRTKILAAMAIGAPVVSTTVGCEGIGAAPGLDLFVEDEPERFAQRVLDLLSAPALGQAMVERARDFVQQHYSFSAVGARRAELLAEVAQVQAKRPSPAGSARQSG